MSLSLRGAERRSNPLLFVDCFASLAMTHGAPMLRAYGPQCDGSIIDAKAERIPDDAAWIDLEEPTREEEALVERCIQVNVPTQDEMAEIEPSSRLYEKNGALYMTISALRGVDEARPTTTPIGF